MIKKFTLACSLFLGLAFFGCNKTTQQKDQSATNNADSTEVQQQTANTPAQIMEKHALPVLCDHRITAGLKRDYPVTPATFASQMQILKDSGYNSISPDQLYDYLVYNKTLPAQPVMITFDDSRIEHTEIAAPVMEKYGFRGVFFIMTITYNKKN